MELNYATYWQDMTQSAMDAAKELEVINTDLMQGLTGAQMELANAAFESGARYMTAISEAQDYQQIVAEQGKAYAEFNETLLASVRSSAEAFGSARDAYQSWFENSLRAIPNAQVPGAA